MLDVGFFIEDTLAQLDTAIANENPIRTCNQSLNLIMGATTE
jgi:hypothetical protein